MGLKVRTIRRKFIRFVLNRLDELSVPTPLEVESGLVFRKATVDEIEAMRRFSDERVLQMIYGVRDLVQRDGVATGRPVPVEEWECYVVESESPQNATTDGRTTMSANVRFEIACVLTSVEVLLGRSILLDVDGAPTASGSLAAVHECQSQETLLFSRSRTAVTSALVSEWQSICGEISTVAGSHPDIARAAEMFAHRHISSAGSLWTFGVFASLESILTRPARGTGDSLMKQISSKWDVLANRFETPVDYSALSKHAQDMLAEKGTSEWLWKHLYYYRSIIAHGGVPDWTRDPKLNVIGEQYDAECFLLAAVKKLLRHALREPQLVTDLRLV